MMTLTGKLLIIPLAMCLVSQVFSQECGDSVPEILDRIEETTSRSDMSELAALLRCLSKPALKWVRDYDAFASEEALQKIERETNGDRLRVYKILIPLSSSEDWLVANEAAAVLAYYGYTPAGQMLESYVDGPLKAVLFAVVDYKRSYRWAIDRLQTLERVSQPQGDLLEARMAYLGLLYHLAEPLSLPFLNGFISSDVEPEVRARAELVKERILELHPRVR